MPGNSASQPAPPLPKTWPAQLLDKTGRGMLQRGREEAEMQRVMVACDALAASVILASSASPVSANPVRPAPADRVTACGNFAISS